MVKFRSIVQLLFAVSIGLGLHGCGSSGSSKKSCGEKYQGKSCQSDNDCDYDGGYVCARGNDLLPEGQCKLFNDGCPAAYQCLDGKCHWHECTVDADCADGLFCADKTYCVMGCSADVQCPGYDPATKTVKCQYGACLETCDKVDNCGAHGATCHPGTEVCLPGNIAGNCIASIDNCISCDADDQNKCSICGEFYEVNSDGTACVESSCLVGSNKIANCASCMADDLTKCQTCKREGIDFKINHDNTLCIPTDAQSCLSGVGKIERCALCRPDNNALCQYCNPPDLYEAETSDGLSCQVRAGFECLVSDDNCLRCNGSNPNNCADTGCKPGYELNSATGKCQIGEGCLKSPNYVSQCKVCDVMDPLKCAECQPNYEIKVDGSVNICVPYCDSMGREGAEYDDGPGYTPDL